jgi:hypothetical protein
MSVFTITFCDRGENHVGNQQIGKLADSGFTFDELVEICTTLNKYGILCELHNLRDLLPEQERKDVKSAGFLIIRNGLDKITNSLGADKKLFDELSGLEFDKHAKMYGRVVQKHARHNLVFADFDQTADYESGKGTIVNFNRLPLCGWIRQILPYLSNNLETKNKLTNLVAELNHYYDIKKCYIGYHSDLERKIVVGLRVGEAYPLHFNWYLKSEKIGTKLDILLNSGDLYIMDEKACGFDGRQKKIPVLRHAAGFDEVLDKKKKKERKE